MFHLSELVCKLFYLIFHVFYSDGFFPSLTGKRALPRQKRSKTFFSHYIYFIICQATVLFHPLRLLSIRPPPTCVPNLHAFWEEKRKSLFKAALQWHCLKKKDVSAWKSSYFVPSEVCALALGTLIANLHLPHFARKSGLVRKKREKRRG